MPHTTPRNDDEPYSVIVPLSRDLGEKLIAATIAAEDDHPATTVRRLLSQALGELAPQQTQTRAASDTAPVQERRPAARRHCSASWMSNFARRN